MDGITQRVVRGHPKPHAAVPWSAFKIGVSIQFRGLRTTRRNPLKKKFAAGKGDGLPCWTRRQTLGACQPQTRPERICG